MFMGKAGRDGGAPLDLTAAIEEFYREFPQHRKDVFILDHQKYKTGAEAIAVMQPGLDALKREFPDAQVDFWRNFALKMFDNHKHQIPASLNISDSPFSMKPETPVYGRIVHPAHDAFDARRLRSMLTGGGAPLAEGEFPIMPDALNNTEMWQRYVLDHELGHALTMLSIDHESTRTKSLGNRAECEADAYAMIRHYQRYGENSKFPEFIRDIRTLNVVHFADVTHWTSCALDVVIGLNKAGKLKDLTPAESRDLAVRIAAKAQLSADASHNMTKAFIETAGITVTAWKKKTGDGDKVLDYLAAVAKTGAETESPAVLELCRRYVNVFPAYASNNSPMSKTKADLDAMAADITAMIPRKLTEEPPMTGLAKIFRDAQIDARTGGKKKPPGNDGKTPPKKKPGRNLKL